MILLRGARLALRAYGIFDRDRKESKVPVSYPKLRIAVIPVFRGEAGTRVEVQDQAAKRPEAIF